jgi:hypothetical protein
MNLHDVILSGGHQLTIFTNLELRVHHLPIGHNGAIPK